MRGGRGWEGENEEEKGKSGWSWINILILNILTCYVFCFLFRIIFSNLK